MNEKVMDASKIAILVICLGFCSGMMLSPELWFNGGIRNYPRVPFFGLPLFSSLLEPVLSGGIMLASVALFSPRLRTGAGCLILLFATLLITLDQSRLQPWFYQYLWFTVALLCCSVDRNLPALQSALRFMLAFIYIWAGLSKCTATYFLYVFPAVFAAGLDLLAEYPLLIFIFAALGPVVEVWIGVCFLFLKNSRLAVLATFSLHALILLAIGPLGINFNSVVWPWNILMPLLAYNLFWHTKDTERPLPTLLASRPLFAALLVAGFVLLPALNKAGYWDNYLSFSLYSGRIPEGSFQVETADRTAASRYFSGAGIQKDGAYTVDIHDWSYATLNVPAYPEERIYRSIFQSVCRELPRTEPLTFTYMVPARYWYSDRVSETWTCD